MSIVSKFENNAEAQQLHQDLHNMGCQMLNETKKVSLFHTRHGKAFYVLWDSKGVRRDSDKYSGFFALALNPNLDTSSIVALPGVVESGKHCNSNLRAFANKGNDSDAGTASGLKVIVEGANNLKHLIGEYDKVGNEVDDKVFEKSSSEVATSGLGIQDVTAAIVMEKRAEPVQTTALREVEQRLHQDEFRRKLDVIWGNQCAVTEVRCRECLVASHIKPWAECSDEEKLDPCNGFLLNVALDALFDNHLITFDQQGLIKISPKVDPATLEALGITRNMRLRQPFVFANHEKYLKHHWQEFVKNC